MKPFPRLILTACCLVCALWIYGQEMSYMHSDGGEVTLRGGGSARDNNKGAPVVVTNRLPLLPLEENVSMASVDKGNDDDDDDDKDDSDRVTYYMHARHDRAGRQLIFMYLLQAKAFKEGGVFGGACDSDEVLNTGRWSDRMYKNFRDHVESAQKLLDFLGWHDRMVFKCPAKENVQSGRAVMLRWRDMRPTTDYLTQEWHTQFLNAYPVNLPPADDNTTTTTTAVTEDGPQKRIVVHVRRGDVTPCDPRDNVWTRYLPNDYYLRVLDEYMPQHCDGTTVEEMARNCEVIIHSEPEALEGFDDFAARDYTLKLGGPLEEVWQDFIDADVLIVSNSAFSFVPAVLNRKVVLYPPMDDGDYSPLPAWTPLPEKWDGLAKEETQRLIQEKCPRGVHGRRAATTTTTARDAPFYTLSGEPMDV